MRILIWNCQGIEGNLTVSSLKEKVKLCTPDMVMLLETKTRSSRNVFLKTVQGMPFMHVVDACGLSGGLCVFWKEVQQVSLVKYADFYFIFIEVGIKDVEKGCVWRFFGVYASTDDRIRRNQWQALRTRIHTC